mmetsp:Transcript_99275/g.286464  ORF Transcript_99275/g.286464 Transcript_99275/m.286464 type:complete len:116 (+) Transcript_99275:2-349(+)
MVVERTVHARQAPPREPSMMDMELGDGGSFDGSPSSDMGSELSAERQRISKLEARVRELEARFQRSGNVVAVVPETCGSGSQALRGLEATQGAGRDEAGDDSVKASPASGATVQL